MFYAITFVNIFQDLQVRLDRQEETSNQLRTDNSNLNHDLNQLVSVISTARTTGTWSVCIYLNSYRLPLTFNFTTVYGGTCIMYILTLVLLRVVLDVAWEQIFVATILL